MIVILEVLFPRFSCFGLSFFPVESLDWTEDHSHVSPLYENLRKSVFKTKTKVCLKYELWGQILKKWFLLEGGGLLKLTFTGVNIFGALEIFNFFFLHWWFPSRMKSKIRLGKFYPRHLLISANGANMRKETFIHYMVCSSCSSDSSTSKE